MATKPVPSSQAPGCFFQIARATTRRISAYPTNIGKRYPALKKVELSHHSRTFTPGQGRSVQVVTRANQPRENQNCRGMRW